MLKVANHHVGLRVASIERSATFYTQAFDATRLTPSFTIAGDAARQVFRGPPETEFAVMLISIGEQTLELFEFTSPRHPTDLIPAETGNWLHLGIEVADVEATTKRVLDAGGAGFWPEMMRLGEWRAMYVTDPDNNVIELLDATVADVVTYVKQTYVE